MKIIGIMGGSLCSDEEWKIAYKIGKEIAKEGYILLCGGGSGIMEAAAKGAYEEGGITIGILPGSNKEESPPNPYIKIPIFTGMSDGRNSINVKTSDIVVAIGGGPGTLSEIALALKNKKPVILLESLEVDKIIENPNLYKASSVEEAIVTLKKIMAFI